MKKRRVTFRDEDGMELGHYRVASLKERVEKVVAEARDIDSALQELLRETVHIKSNKSHEPDTCTYGIANACKCQIFIESLHIVSICVPHLLGTSHLARFILLRRCLFFQSAVPVLCTAFNFEPLLMRRTFIPSSSRHCSWLSNP